MSEDQRTRGPYVIASKAVPLFRSLPLSGFLPRSTSTRLWFWGRATDPRAPSRQLSHHRSQLSGQRLPMQHVSLGSIFGGGFDYYHLPSTSIYQQHHHHHHQIITRIRSVAVPCLHAQIAVGNRRRCGYRPPPLSIHVKEAKKMRLRLRRAAWDDETLFLAVSSHHSNTSYRTGPLLWPGPVI
jgi:hypothetical protein